MKDVKIDLLLEGVVLDLVNEIDYDIYKDLDPDLAEDPQYSKERLKMLVSVLRLSLSQKNLLNTSS